MTELESPDPITDAELEASGVLPTQWQIAAERYINAGTRFTDDAKPSAQVINCMLDMLDEYRILSVNETERAQQLQMSIDQLNTDLNAANRRIDDLTRGIERIASLLLDEADERGWCDEYNQFVDNVNQGLREGVPFLEKLAETFTISFDAVLTAEQAVELEGHIDDVLRDKIGTSSCTGYEYETVN